MVSQVEEFDQGIEDACDHNEGAAENTTAIEQSAASSYQAGEKPDLIIDGGDLPATARDLRDSLARAGCIFNRAVPVKIVPSSDGCASVPDLQIPESPTRADAKAALRLLRESFRTFPFADAARRTDPKLGVEVVNLDHAPGMDESAFLVGLLTAICRPGLWLAPGFLVRAPEISGAGTGKGYWCAQSAPSPSASAHAPSPRAATARSWTRGWPRI
jgi:hypothetical protein